MEEKIDEQGRRFKRLQITDRLHVFGFIPYKLHYNADMLAYKVREEGKLEENSLANEICDKKTSHTTSETEGNNQGKVAACGPAYVAEFTVHSPMRVHLRHRYTFTQLGADVVVVDFVQVNDQKSSLAHSHTYMHIFIYRYIPSVLSLPSCTTRLLFPINFHTFRQQVEAPWLLEGYVTSSAHAAHEHSFRLFPSLFLDRDMI